MHSTKVHATPCPYHVMQSFESKVRAALYTLFLAYPDGWYTAAEIAEEIEGAEAREVAILMLGRAGLEQPEWVTEEVSREGDRKVTVYRHSRWGIAQELQRVQEAQA